MGVEDIAAISFISTIDEDQDKKLLIAQQHTLVWNESHCLDIAPGQAQQPLSVIYDVYAEELSFPSIYYGHPRTIKPEGKGSPFNMATSELRRKDRRGARADHLLYVAMKVLRLRVSSGLYSTFVVTARTANITRRMLEDRLFLEHCVEKNSAFLKSIPNSMEYWSNRKEDLFAMIRQLGKPTLFLTLSANEVRWPNLLRTLHR